MSVTEEAPATELVEVESKTAPVPAPIDDPVLDSRNASIEAAAAAAVAMPGAPGREEFMTLAMTAKMLSLSGAAPQAIQDNPYVAFHVAMVGRDLGISPSAAMDLIDVIPGKGGKIQLSLSPQLLNGQIRRLGLGSIRPRERSEFRCVAIAYGPDGEELGDSEFTWEDARMAGLVGRNCQPGEHKSSSDKGCGCNQGYKTYPKRMLWWRASGFAADDFFPEAGLGLYTAEEMGALVDENGRAIDPMTVALPDGYEQKAVTQGGTGEVDQRADATDLWRLQLRILALPGEETDDLRARWQQLAKLKGYKPHALSVTQYRLAESVLSGLEKRAKSKHGYNAQTASLEALDTVVAHLVTLTSPVWGTPGAPEGEFGGEWAAEPVEAPEMAETAATQDAGGTADGPIAAAQAEQVAVNEALDEELVPEAEVVKGMRPASVKEHLFQRGLSVEGDIVQLRKRLVLQLIRERLERDGKPEA